MSVFKLKYIKNVKACCFIVFAAIFGAVIFTGCEQKSNIKIVTFSVNFSADSDLGTVSASFDGKNRNAENGMFTVEEGTEITFTASAKDGYEIKQWKHNGKIVNGKKKAYTIKVENHVFIVVSFQVPPPELQEFDLRFSFDETCGSLTAKTEDGDPVSSGNKILENTKIIFTAEPKKEYYVDGWVFNGNIVNEKKSAYELTIQENSEVKVRFSNIKYDDEKYFVNVNIEKPLSFPVKVDDSGTGKIISSFAAAKYELTYELWYEVYMWAISNGYTFINAGIAGSKGEAALGTESQTGNNMPVPAKLETGDERLKQPVTKISWRDAIVWCNAYSQKNNLEPVYKYNGQIIKDAGAKSSGINFDTDFLDGKYVKGNGYRLLTSYEWEFAARLTETEENCVKENGKSVSATVNGKNYFFTKGNSASGANDNVNNVEECKRVAWYDLNSKEGYGNEAQTHVVACKEKNALGLYDMSGNVYELCFEKYDDTGKRIRAGGCWWFNSEGLRVASRLSGPVEAKNDYVGFRLAKNIGEPFSKDLTLTSLQIGDFTKTDFEGIKIINAGKIPFEKTFVNVSLEKEPESAAVSFTPSLKGNIWENLIEGQNELKIKLTDKDNSENSIEYTVIIFRSFELKTESIKIGGRTFEGNGIEDSTIPVNNKKDLCLNFVLKNPAEGNEKVRVTVDSSVSEFHFEENSKELSMDLKTYFIISKSYAVKAELMRNQNIVETYNFKIDYTKPIEIIDILKVKIASKEYLKTPIFGSPSLSKLVSGDETIDVNGNFAEIEITLNEPKESNVVFKHGTVAPETVSGTDGVYLKRADLTFDGLHFFEIIISKTDYETVIYKFKINKTGNVIQPIPIELRIDKLWAGTGSSKASAKIYPENPLNPLEYDIELPASSAGLDLNFWIRGNERDARVLIKGESADVTADGSERLSGGELSESGSCRIVITVKYEGAEQDYMLNIKIK